ncbi:MAG: SRPBCC family protein [Candidatus Methylomirabilales bacterium]
MTAMATSGTAVVSTPAETQIMIRREFAAPKHLVYRAWTTPELITRWWAGKRGTVTVADVDLRLGGKWRWVMIAGGGFEVAFSGEYREIVPNERLVYTERYEAVPGPGILCTLEFAEKGGSTTVTLLSECGSRQVRDMILASGMEGGMQEGWDLLEQVAMSLA